MTGIGHNGAPAFDAHSMHIEDMFALVSFSTTGAVQTDEQEAALDGLLDELRAAKKAADAERSAEKKPHDDAAKAVQEKWRPLLARCDAASDAIKAALTPFRVAKQLARDEAARQARDEAEARQKAAEAALRSADDLEERFAAEATLKQADKLAKTANRIDRQATGLRTIWLSTVADPSAFLRWVKQHRADDLKGWLADLAASLVRSGSRELPGVEITEDKKAA